MQVSQLFQTYLFFQSSHVSRIRHVKCDETKPECTKCKSTGRKCDGYNVVQVCRRRRLPPTVMMIVHHGVSFQYGKPISCQYFHEVSIPALSNYNSASFWTTTVQQACVAEECIKELAIAIACLERYNVEHELQLPHVRKQCFVQHYCRGLNMLSRHQDASIVMIASLLLIVIGDMTKNPYTAFIHINSGRRLLSNTEVGINPDLTASMRPIFDRLVAHSPELSTNCSRIERWQEHILFASDGKTRITAEARPTTLFHNLDEAAHALYSLRYRCLHSTRTTPPLTRFHIVPGITEQLNSWLEDFNEFTITRKYQERLENRTRVHSLRAYQLILSIASRCCPYNTEKLFDNHSHDFDGLVKKLTILSQLGSRNLAPLLFFVVCKYRDVAGRRTALNMLMHQPCGAQGNFLASIAGKIIETEEAAAYEPVTCDDIPESARVRPQAVFQDTTTLSPPRLRLALLRWPYRKDSVVKYVTLSVSTQNEPDTEVIGWKIQVWIRSAQYLN